jgi:hypothetical protein
LTKKDYYIFSDLDKKLDIDSELLDKSTIINYENILTQKNTILYCDNSKEKLTRIKNTLLWIKNNFHTVEINDSALKLK